MDERARSRAFGEGVAVCVRVSSSLFCVECERAYIGTLSRHHETPSLAMRRSRPWRKARACRIQITVFIIAAGEMLADDDQLTQCVLLAHVYICAR